MALNLKGLASLLVKPKAPEPPAPKAVVKAPIKVAKPPKSLEDSTLHAPPKSGYKEFVPFDFVLPEDEYTIIHALKELAAGRKGTLMLVKKSTGVGYKVMGLYEDDKVALEGPNGLSFRPKVGMREVPQYTPVWR